MSDLLNTTFIPNTVFPRTPRRAPKIACFAEDTMILTRKGERAITDLAPGDSIPTYDDGMQPLAGICAQHVPAEMLLSHPGLRPLAMPGAGLDPNHHLRLSPSHCVLHSSPEAELLFGAQEVLVRARHIEAIGQASPGIPRDGVTYFHLLFQEHSMVLANGIWSETYLNTSLPFDPDFPDMDWRFAPGVTLENTRHSRAARLILHDYEAQVLFDGYGAIQRTAPPPPPEPEPLPFGRSADRRA